MNRIERAFLLGLLGLGGTIAIVGEVFLGIEGSLGAGAGFVLWGLILLLALRAVRSRFGTNRVPPEFRDAVLQVLAAAARRGESVGAALHAVAEEVGGRRRNIALHALARLDAGASLADALGDPKCPLLSPIQAESIRAAEGTGRVDEVLLACTGVDAERTGMMRTAILSTAYGLVLFAHGTFVSSYILPQFFAIGSQVLDDGGAVPRSTEGALNTLVLPVRAYPVAFQASILAVLLLVVCQEFFRNPRTAALVRGALLRVPGPGTVIRLDAGERVCRMLGILVSAGRPLHEALARAAATAGVGGIRKRLEEAAASIAEGDPVSRALPGSGLPPFAENRLVLAAGGSPDSLGRALGALAVECAERSRARASALAAGVYPVVLVVAAGLALLTYRGIFLVTGSIHAAMRPW
jgi:type II secretory pathway component PulF